MEMKLISVSQFRIICYESNKKSATPHFMICPPLFPAVCGRRFSPACSRDPSFLPFLYPRLFMIGRTAGQPFPAARRRGEAVCCPISLSVSSGQWSLAVPDRPIHAQSHKHETDQKRFCKSV